MVVFLNNQGHLCSHSWISLVSCLPFQDFISFGKKSHHKEHWNQSYLRVWHLCSQWHSRSCSHSCLYSQICVYLQNQSHACSQADQQNWLCACNDLLVRMTYQACGIDPSKKLTGKNIYNYNPWAHLIQQKLKVDKILFPTNPDKTDYVFLQIKALIWNKINTWVIIQRDSSTVNWFWRIKRQNTQILPYASMKATAAIRACCYWQQSWWHTRHTSLISLGDLDGNGWKW